MIATFLEILDGPLAGTQHQVREGMRIGRATGEILLEDPKVSSLHAQVEKDGKGGYVLVDRGSANGLRINGQRVKRVALLPGVKFAVGKTQIKVFEQTVEHLDEVLLNLKAESSKRDWREILQNDLLKLPLRNLEGLMRVDALRPALQLDFLEGIQMEHQVILGYGPRRFGSDVLDIEIREPLCPPLAFEIFSEDGEAVFRTQFPKLVLLNESPVATAPLKEGDRIRIGQTLIQVSYAS